ncbi:hypothetical protein PEC301937_06610 [Pectobacterium carotovorum subsp. carotovorum]|nr:hypothetical protein PEC301937_06610 [Pectobacterium carotovorum subsp. carotovorum]
MGRVFASQAVRTAGVNTEGTAKRRDLPRKSQGSRGDGDEPPRVGRLQRELRRVTLLIAHETFTVTTETTKEQHTALLLLMMKKKDLLPSNHLNR